jgi:hypothetical protein
MKRIVFLVLIIFIFSCKKDEPCYICDIQLMTTTASSGNPSTTVTTNTTVKKCDLTESAIEDFQTELTTSSTTTSGTATVIVRQTCTCSK